MTDQPGDVSAWLRTTMPLVEQASDDGHVATAASMFGPVQKWGWVLEPARRKLDALEEKLDALEDESQRAKHGRDELAALVKAAVFDSDGSTWLNIADAIIANGWTHP